MASVTNRERLDRVDCPHAATCGGCPLIGLPYAEQLERKAAMVSQALFRFPLLRTLRVDEIIGATKRAGYRTRAKLVVGPEGIGLYRPGGHELLDLPGCRVLPDALAAIVGGLRQFLLDGILVPHTPIEPGVRGIDLRGSDEDGALLTLIVDDAPDARAAAESAARRIADQLPGIAGVFVAPHGGRTPRLLAAGAYAVAGKSSVLDRVGDTVYLAGPGSFVQASREQAARVHAAIAEYVDARSGARVLDLFAGGGGIGLSLARAGARVTMIESYAPAIDDARRSARLNGVTIDAVAADAENGLDGLNRRRERFDAIVVNPPRRGLSVAIREKIVRLRPTKLAYVSCDPETLARDLDHFRRLGYATQRLVAVDMIPLSEHVESVAFLAPAPPPHPPVLFQDEALLVIDRWSDEPLISRTGRSGSTLARVRKRRAWSEAVPWCGADDAASGVCVLVPRTEDVPGSNAELSARAAVLVLTVGGPPRADAVRGLALAIECLAHLGAQSLLRIELEATAVLRLRSALAAAGHAIVGDARQGHEPTNRYFTERNGLSRAFVHVERVEVTHPTTRQSHCFTAPIAPDLTLVLARMGVEDVGAVAAATP